MSERVARRILAAILVLFVTLGLAYAFITPTMEAPDEIHHYDYIRSLANTGRPPVLEEGGGKGFGHHAPLYYTAGALVSFWVGEGDLDQWRARHNPFFGYRFGDVGRDNKNLYLHPEDDRFGASDTWLGIRVVRALSVLMGAATVWVVYQVARQVFPSRPELAVGAAGLAAFIPEFLFISGAVNDDNGATLCGALALWAMTRILRQGPSPRRCVVLGLTLGLGWLSKLTVMALLPTAGLTLLLVALRNRSWRDLLRWGLVVFGVAAVLIVPWLVRQTVLYGDPTGTSREISEWGPRDRSVVLADLLPDLYWLRTSFWGRLGYNQIPLSGGIYALLDIVTLLAALGLARLAIRHCRSPLRTTRNSQVVVLATALLLTLAPMIVRRFLRPMPNFGRYLFPVLPAIALLMITGLTAWLPRRLHVFLAMIVAAGMLLLGSVGLVCFLAPAYARPPVFDASTAPQPAQGLDWVYLEDGEPFARLRGYDVDRTSVRPRDTVRVTLYWEVLAETDMNYILFAQLFGQGGAKVGQRDTYPGLGHYPTSFWRCGQVIQDEVPIRVHPNAAAPSRLRLDLGLYRRGGERLAVVDHVGKPVGAATAGWLRLASVEEIKPPAASVDYRVGDAVALIGYDLSKEEGTLHLVLHWTSLARIDEDYTVFVHLIGPDGELAVQADGPPIGGDYPTSFWPAGELIPDERRISTEDLPPGRYEIRVGMYLLGTGERLPAMDADGTVLPDGVVPLAEVDLP